MHPETVAPADQLAFDRIAQTQRPLLLGRRRDTHPLDRFLAERGLGDAIVGTLRGEERALGFLIVGNRAGDIGTFTETERELFETFAGHASVLLENSRLEQSLAQVTELQEELRHQAYHDALTGLPNRVLFTDQVTETLARDQDGRDDPRSPLPGPRPLQEHQRQLGPRRGRRAPRAGGRPPPGPDPAVRRGRPAGRRRVRAPAGEHRRGRGGGRRAANRREAEHDVLGHRARRPRSTRASGSR